MLRGAKNTVQGAKMAFGTPFLATPFGVALKKNLTRANDSQKSGAEDRNSHSKPMSSPTSSFGHGCTGETPQASKGAERVGVLISSAIYPPLTKFQSRDLKSGADDRNGNTKPMCSPSSSFEHGGTVETLQASEDAERVGVLTPSAIYPPSTKFLSRDPGAVEERKSQQGEDGDKDAKRKAQQFGVSTWVDPASSVAMLCSPRTEIALEGGIREAKMEIPPVVYPSKAVTDRLSSVTVGTSSLKAGESKSTNNFSQVLGPSSLSFTTSKECSSDKDGSTSILHKDKAKEISSEDERYCSSKSLYCFPSSHCLDRNPNLGESLGHGGPDEIPQDCVGSQGIVLTPLAVLPPSSSTRPPCWDLVAVQGRELQQCENGDKDEYRGNETILEGTESWDESCLARFSKFLGFSTAGHEEEILEFLKRFNVGRKRGKGKGGDRTTKFDREMKKLAWNVTDTVRKKDGGLGKEVRAYCYNRR